MKKKKTSTTSYFDETIPACYMQQGEFCVPVEWELYYVRAWKWKLTRDIPVEKHKIKYLWEYEKRNGDITEWQDHTGALRPIYVDDMKTPEYVRLLAPPTHRHNEVLTHQPL